MWSEKFDISTHPRTFAYVLENGTFNRRCNACMSLVLKMPPKNAMHNPPKPYQCMECDVEIDEDWTTVGDFQTDEEFEELLLQTAAVLLLDDMEGD